MCEADAAKYVAHSGLQFVRIHPFRFGTLFSVFVSFPNDFGNTLRCLSMNWCPVLWGVYIPPPPVIGLRDVGEGSKICCARCRDVHVCGRAPPVFSSTLCIRERGTTALHRVTTSPLVSWVSKPSWLSRVQACFVASSPGVGQRCRLDVCQCVPTRTRSTHLRFPHGISSAVFGGFPSPC